jgi:hypothetical protein
MKLRLSTPPFQLTKLRLPIPSFQISDSPSFYISTQAPKVRIPFLSMLIEPRSLAKWYFMWAFCLYLIVCMGFYFYFEQPRLNHEAYYRFGADSPTYWDAAKYRTEHADGGSTLVSFASNLLGPVVIALVLKNGVAVAAFNILLFFIAVEIACSIPGVDRYRLLLLLALAAETPPALVTLNKEILVLVSALLLAKYIYAKRRSWPLLAVVLLFSLFTRWEQVAIILLFLFVQRRRSIFKRNPRLAVIFVIGLYTLIYPVVARLPGSGLRAFTQYTKGANTIVKLNTLQANFGFPLALPFKLVLDVFGELLRPMTYLKELDVQGWGDIHSMFIIPLFSIALIALLVIAYRKGRLNPRYPIALLIMIYMITTAVTPFVQPRYNYFVYVLLCLELARKEEPAEMLANPRESLVLA